MKTRWLSAIAIVIWTIGVVGGLRRQSEYEYRPARTNVAQDHWPATTTCVLSGERPTLVMFVHPRCGCSRASLSELGVLMKNCEGRLDAQVVFLMPQAHAAEWSKSDLWSIAQQIPGVTTRWDVDGVEHQRFQATTSGEVFLYRPDGDLVMHGGITPGRGHTGENRGRSAIERFVIDGRDPGEATQVFGCGLDSCQVSTREIGK